MHRVILSEGERGVGTDKAIRLENLRLNDGTILIFIMRK